MITESTPILDFMHSFTMISPLGAVTVAALSGAGVGRGLAPLTKTIARQLLDDRQEETDTRRSFWVMVIGATILAASAVVVFGCAKGAAVALFSIALLMLAVIDQRYRLLPDVITLPLIWGGLLVNVYGNFVPLRSAVIGAVAGYAFFWLLFLPLRLRGTERGMEFGDFKLYAALGAWLGWEALPQVFVFSLVSALLCNIPRAVVYGRQDASHFAFGPYIVGAGIFTAFFGDILSPWFGVGPFFG